MFSSQTIRSFDGCKVRYNKILVMKKDHGLAKEQIFLNELFTITFQFIYLLKIN